MEPRRRLTTPGHFRGADDHSGGTSTARSHVSDRPGLFSLPARTITTPRGEERLARPGIPARRRHPEDAAPLATPRSKSRERRRPPDEPGRWQAEGCARSFLFESPAATRPVFPAATQLPPTVAARAAHVPKPQDRRHPRKQPRDSQTQPHTVHSGSTAGPPWHGKPGSSSGGNLRPPPHTIIGYPEEGILGASFCAQVIAKYPRNAPRRDSFQAPRISSTRVYPFAHIKVRTRV
ncbi:hypothetical protein HPB48_020173 [Haemaphysalis longicornis]|uniref:Uncharacterized protein n=1 Tax=Haemaphysalis longicornis TaxID=44386 RepID=A0A9J6FJ99_HAELO|nr:hypothetical protein HPB48_020173 [Haemaphysalis longicornis]